MKVQIWFAGAALACAGMLAAASAGAAPTGALVVAADNDHQHDKAAPPGGGGSHPGGGGQPSGGNHPGGSSQPSGGGQQSFGQRFQEQLKLHQQGGSQSGSQGGGGAMQGQRHDHSTNGQNSMSGQMMMHGGNSMMSHGTSHQNFDRSAFQRNVTATRHFHAPQRYRRPQGWYSHRWVYGEILPSLFWSQNYWISDYYDYDLPDPPPGFIWVRYGDDALLVDQDSGEVLQADYGLFD